MNLRGCGCHVAIVNVVIECVIEQHSVLRNDANALPNGLLSVVTDIVIANLDLSLQRIIKTK
jgi:hypothetical protein